MKRALTSASLMTAILITATFVWAGGMGGGMGGGGHMMDSSGNGRMGSGRYDNHDSVQGRQAERQRAQVAYDHDMQRLDRQIRDKEQALDAESQKNSPDKTKVAKLRRELSDLEHRFDDRRIGFESRWGQDERR
jgi:hypothetical protein